MTILEVVLISLGFVIVFYILLKFYKLIEDIKDDVTLVIRKIAIKNAKCTRKKH